MPYWAYAETTEVKFDGKTKHEVIKLVDLEKAVCVKLVREGAHKPWIEAIFQASNAEDGDLTETLSGANAAEVFYDFSRSHFGVRVDDPSLGNPGVEHRSSQKRNHQTTK